MFPRWLIGVIGVCLIGSSQAAGPDYARQIKPLLQAQCVKCHGSTQQKGGLRLDTAAAIRHGGDHGDAIRPGNPADSLLVQVLLGEHDGISQMPYKRTPLEEGQVSLLRKWIQGGAVSPEDEIPSSDRHWAFVPPVRPGVPALPPPADPGVNAIDRFVRARLAVDGFRPAPEANRETLLRRVTLDLTGLPPTESERSEFLSDPRPEAYERLVDRLLASPHFGERQGRIWLDLARYADSNGYSIDSVRSMWPYRDWVVDAMNRDLPFETFTVLQLAGDLLTGIPHEMLGTNRPPPKVELESGERARWLGGWRLDSTDPMERWSPLIASGFHRNTQVNHEGGIDPEQFRIESAMDRVNTTATVWLGITLACAQCHDHKFDPFSQRDYYRMFAFFNSGENDGHGNPGLLAENVLDLNSASHRERIEGYRKELQAREKDLRQWLTVDLQKRQSAWETGMVTAVRNQLPGLTRELLDLPPEKRTSDQSNVVWSAFRDRDPEYKARRSEIDTYRRKEPVSKSTLIMRERPEPRRTVVFVKGDFTRPGEPVLPGIPEVFGKGRKGEEQWLRLDLARWLVNPTNPLVSRVVVNRLWQQYFGRGLVETENDFGTQGSLPSHPELLDWLATEFLKGGANSEQSEGRMKRMHRLIVSSATYRQSSVMRPELAEKDPRNILLARQNRLRLDAELIRDTALVTSGALDRRMGGPPVFPPQPAGLGAFTQNSREWVASAGGDRFRRGLYTHLQRTSHHPALAVFDAADGFTSCTRRLRSNTPLQALTLLNDPAFHELAREFGEDLRRSEGSKESRLRSGFVKALGREPGDLEERHLTRILTETENASEAWSRVARVLLNLDERMTRE